LVARLVREDEGQDLIEYALLATLVALAAAVGATALGTNLDGWYTSMAGRVTTWSGTAGS
jgi:pilus assembly protein Flp/PilA